MKYFISLISALLFTFTVFAQGVLEIKQSRQTLKNLLADDQPMTVVYTAQNTGTQPVIITRVTPMTSLLKADWPKSPLLPGKSCDIKITFIPMQLLENFNMRILVYSNANPARKELILTGNLVDNPSKPELLYKYNMNGLKFKNNLKDAVSLGVIYKSNHLQATFEPAQVAPGKKGKIIVTFDAPKANDYGYVYESLILSVNGSKEYSNRLSVTAELSEDFSKLSPKDKANAPIAQFDKKECNFGEIKQGEKTSCDFTLTNAGKSILFIRKTKASCGCTAVTLGQKEIQPGQSTTIRATFDSTGKSGRQYKSITVITNDPSQPENTLTISGNVK